MIYDLTKPLQRQRFKTYCNNLYKKQKLVELAEKKPKRTLSQNNYLHLLLAYFALQTGNTVDDVKRLYYKTLCNPDLFVIQRHDDFFGHDIRVLRSSSDLTTEEMSMSIERFKQWAAEVAGIYLPDATKPEEVAEAWQEVNTYEARKYL